ncbi:MAG: thioredoxin family protein [Chitinophagales bacterium]|nr:thioredoxin family protein [Chitinophagales bacterium]MCZ2394385.1 thioredoxin family protein [Chitinophagales bacterium]
MKDFKYWWESGMQWEAYRDMLDRLMLEGRTTGSEQSEDLLSYARLNLQRMKRIDKTFKEDSQLKDFFLHYQGQLKIIAITEGWCGDASQSVPVVANLVQLHPDKLDLRIILRDKDTELIDQFLTNGGRAIPKFIFLNGDYQLGGNWGPRPKELQDIYIELKNQQLPFETISENIHSWYAKDKAKTIQNELLELLSKMNF